MRGDMDRRELISDEYLEQLELYRQKKPHWGPGGANRHSIIINGLIQNNGYGSVLDYGCGNGALLDQIECSNKTGYDPGIPRFSKTPELPFDLVVSTDVLEHIEPDRLDAVLAHIAQLTRKKAYLVIHCGPAQAVLPDGRNAHLIQEPPDWWVYKLDEYFSAVDYGVRQPMPEVAPSKVWVTVYATP